VKVIPQIISAYNPAVSQTATWPYLAGCCFYISRRKCFLFVGVCPQIGWLQVTVAVVLTSLLEAWTSQIDNVVLPLFMYSLLAI